MTRTFVIQLGNDIQARALLHEDAYALADQFWDSLPFDGICRQVHWSGECGYLKNDSLVNLEPIKHRPMSMYFPGAVAMRPAWGEIALAYGPSQARDEYRTGAVAVHLATVIDGLDDYLRALASMPYTGEIPYTMTKES